MVHSSLGLVLLAAACSSAEPCVNGRCTSGSAETTTILQSKRYVSKLANQRSTTQLSQLLESATQLLKSGATPDVIQFTQDTLADLRNDILPAITAAHESDVQRLADAVDAFGPVTSRYETQKGELSLLRNQVQEAREVHKACRTEQSGHCQRATECENERQRLEDILKTQRNEYKVVMDSIGGQYCEQEHDHTDASFREHSASNFETYLKEGKEMIAARVAHDEQREKCNQLEATLQASKEKCDDDKRALERASCTVRHERILVVDDLNTAWAIEQQNLRDSKATVQTLEEHRKTELRGLKQIECILDELYKRGGKACDEEAGEADQIAADCASAGSDVSSLVITYPQEPAKPEVIVADPHPCDDEFLKEEYLQFSGACFSDMAACHACAQEAEAHVQTLPAEQPAPPPAELPEAAPTPAEEPEATQQVEQHVAEEEAAEESFDAANPAHAVSYQLLQSGQVCGDFRSVEEDGSRSLFTSQDGSLEKCAEAAAAKGFKTFIFGVQFQRTNNCYGGSTDSTPCSDWRPTTLFDSYSVV